MSALIDFLFPAPAPRRALAVLHWWETRRFKYNLIVGAAGCVSLASVFVVSLLPPASRGAPTDLSLWQPVVVFGVLANVCYLLGPLVEMGINRLWGRRVLPAGPTLFRMGLTFSVGLALLPTLIVGIDWVYRLIRWLI